MKTPIDRLNFALQLADMNLATLREGDRLNLRDDVIAFLDWPESAKTIFRIQQKLNLSQICEMQEDTRYILRELAAGLLWFKNKGEHNLRSWNAISRKVPAGLWLDSSTDPSDGKPLRHRVTVEVKGKIALDFLEPGSLQANLIGFSELRTAFRLKLVSTFAAVGIPSLRFCPGCSKVFIAEHGKRQFCSDRCKGRVTDRKYRAGHRSELAERAHRYYRQKTEAKTPTKNIQRRKRAPGNKRRIT